MAGPVSQKVFQLFDKENRVYRSALLDAAKWITSSGEREPERKNSERAAEEENLHGKDLTDPEKVKAAERAIEQVWNFCSSQFGEGRDVRIRGARNRADTEASVSGWWDLKEWVMRYRYADGGHDLLESLHAYCSRNKINLPRVGITFGSAENEIYNTSVFFRNQFAPEWMRDELNQRMIRDVDRSIVQGDYSIISPVLGNISPFMLSGGVKTLILIHEMPERVYNASNCGDNCARWILQMAREIDFDITLHHIMDFGKHKFNFYITNDRKTVNTMGDYIDSAARNLR